MPEPAKLVAVLDDLMFTVKILDAAKRLEIAAKFVKTEADALIAAAEGPRAILLDLNCCAVDTVSLAARLKADEGAKAIPLLAFVSHVQTDLIDKARRAGVDVVLARSAFSRNLPELLRRYYG